MNSSKKQALSVLISASSLSPSTKQEILMLVPDMSDTEVQQLGIAFATQERAFLAGLRKTRSILDSAERTIASLNTNTEDNTP